MCQPCSFEEETVTYRRMLRFLFCFFLNLENKERMFLFSVCRALAFMYALKKDKDGTDKMSFGLCVV